jgi:hypothetical protein
MVSGHVRAMYATLNRRVRVDYGKRLWTFRQTDVFLHNPKIAAPNDFEAPVYRARVNGLRPYHTFKTTEQWGYNLDYRPMVGELFFTEAEIAEAPNLRGCVVINNKVKPGASPNKDWGHGRWAEFLRLAREAGHRLVEICPPEYGSFVERVETRSFRQACAALRSATAYVGHESGLHHAAAALGVPGVVIFGGFTPIELTGYAIHRNLGVSLDDACGRRRPCPHCEAEMAKITPEQVLAELKAKLQWTPT